MNTRGIHTIGGWLLSLVLSATTFVGPDLAQPAPPSGGNTEQRAEPWDRSGSREAVQADAWFENYRFRSGETLQRLKIHYAMLGTPHRNARGEIDNAVLMLHWTGADGRALLSPLF